ncbi:hypothetical protein J4732_07885 [Serratia marcescens]|uniref:Uncharacterized protein n=1 Tax=Serratia marcescens TaxID=615 RepID=A0A939NQ92_SERMA|nr:hypothetical protein [Serratia marcescens]
MIAGQTTGAARLGEGAARARSVRPSALAEVSAAMAEEQSRADSTAPAIEDQQVAWGKLLVVIQQCK